MEAQWRLRAARATAAEEGLGTAPPRGALARAADYESRVDAALRRAAPAGLTRVDSGVDRRLDERTEARTGPLVVEARWVKEDGAAVVGASTAVSRSIGDWDSSRALVPEPGLRTVDVPAGAYRRFVIASDGLWASVKEKRVVQAAHDRATAGDPAKCATALLAAVVRANARHPRPPANPGDVRDDTTIVVVDVAPGEDNEAAALLSRPPTSGGFRRSLSFTRLSGLASSSFSSIHAGLNGLRLSPDRAGDGGAGTTPTRSNRFGFPNSAPTTPRGGGSAASSPPPNTERTPTF